VQINWCLKGIAENPWFGDAEAQAVLTSTGILSNFMVETSLTAQDANIAAQTALSDSALDDHVNNYSKVRLNTPYISLSAGCYEYAGRKNPAKPYLAMRTALRFATRSGRSAGYVFRCWVITGLKRAPELPGFAEETRDVNLFWDFYKYHYQSEVTAKLVVPRRQIESVTKFDRNQRAINWPGGNPILTNKDFIAPDAVSNVIGEI
jgi:hypothetical protein